MNVFVDDVIRKLLEIRNDGFTYCNIDIVPACAGELGFLSFEALNFGGIEGIDYCDDLDTDVTEVSNEEIEQYADQNAAPAPGRKLITKIEITY